MAPFAKGQSGNPKGRPSRRAALAPALRAVLMRRAEAGDKSNREQFAEAVFATAIGGDVAAMKLIFDRVDGPLPKELTGPDGGPLLIPVQIYLPDNTRE